MLFKRPESETDAQTRATRGGAKNSGSPMFCLGAFVERGGRETEVSRRPGVAGADDDGFVVGVAV